MRKKGSGDAVGNVHSIFIRNHTNGVTAVDRQVGRPWVQIMGLNSLHGPLAVPCINNVIGIGTSGSCRPKIHFMEYNSDYC